MTSVRVVIIDDSATMRALIKASLKDDPEIDVVGEAGDAYAARDAIKALSPDVITLDVEMPRMNGLEFLDKIMRLRPMPVIMISANTQEGAAVSIEALAMGAVDCIGKPTSGSVEASLADLPEKIKTAAKAVVRQKPGSQQAVQNMHSFMPNDKLVAIGASTGGVDALMTLLSVYPENCPPTLITQHMPESFTASFAERLNRFTAPVVVEACDGMPIKQGHVYIAPGGGAHLEIAGKENFRCALKEGPLVSGHRPSVDALFRSFARLRSRAVGVILTGMGRDGAEGLLEIRQAGGRTLGQDEKSCVVYGMPHVAHKIGAVEKQAHLSRIGWKILALCRASNAKVA